MKVGVKRFSILAMSMICGLAFFDRMASLRAFVATSSPILFRNLKQSARVFSSL